MTLIPSWLRWWRVGSKPQAGLESNPPAYSNLPQSEAGPQNVSSTHEAPPLVRATVDNAKPNEPSTEPDKSMETSDLAEDMTLGRNKSLQTPTDVPGQVSLHNNDAAGESSEQQGSTTRDPPSNTDSEPHSGAPEVTGRSQALRSQWSQLDNNLRSFTGRLITADDLRRDAVRKGSIAMGKLEDILASTESAVLPGLKDTLLELTEAQTKLQEKDEQLIQQSFQIRGQAKKIFGPTAGTSFQVLNDQRVTVQSDESDTEGSLLAADDIRLDQTAEARRYLSQKGDVDALQDILINLDAERIILSEANEPPDALEELETRHKEVSDELRRAKEDLTKLYNELPERKVTISEDQLSLPSEREQRVCSQGDTDHREPGSVSGSQPQSEAQGSSLSQILESGRDDGPILPTTLVNAYLDYQLQQSSQDQQAYSKATEDAKQEGNEGEK